MAAIKSEIGNTYGRLTVTSRSESKIVSGKKVTHWNCSCSCGGTLVVAGAALRGNRTKSCGCLNSEVAKLTHRVHGHSPRSGASKAYHAWESMLRRCRCKDHPLFSNYGGRGISVCESWSTFSNFHKDMGDPPAGLTLERVENDLGYSKANCVWATRMEQVCNRRSSIKVSINNETKVLKHWCDDLGISYQKARRRVKNGEDATHVVTSMSADL